MTDHESSETLSSFPQEIAGGGVVLTLTPGQVYVEFADPLSPAETKAFLEQYRLQPVETASGIVSHRDVGDAPLQRGLFQWTTGEDTARFIAEIRADRRVRTASPVYHRADLSPAETMFSFSDHVLVHFWPHAPEKEIETLIAGLDTEVVATWPYAREGTLYQLRLRFPKRQDVFAIVAELARSPLVRHAGPDWNQLHSPASWVPNDSKLSQQWNLYKISAPGGWDIARGTPRVVIAILDTGCDLNHPDLVDKYVPDADRLDVLDNTNTPDDRCGHGTMCAGVAAAETDNHVGVAGVAPNCSIMPIRMYDCNHLANGGIEWFGLSEGGAVTAINWARTHGADVISMSWAYDGPHHNLDFALEEAYQANVLLVAATGNCFWDAGCTDPTVIQYPATHPRVMAVGASNHDDRRQAQTDGGNRPWDSRYGPEISVVAPGIDVPTTDIHGIGGFNTTPGTEGDYAFFLGTSAAAPHVAGLAALVMSWRPYTGKYGLMWTNPPRNDLTNYQVRRIIEATAEKVGGYTYHNDPLHSHGTWNREMGYGRVNVASALIFAREYAAQEFERVNRAYALSALILFGLAGGGGGVVLPPGGPPVPVDPGWMHLTPEQRDVLLGLAITELAKGIDNAGMRQAMERAGWDAIKQTAQRVGQEL